MSVLEQAYMDLRARTAAAYEADNGHEGHLLEALTDVADYVKRVGDHPDSAHYRADKAGELVWASLRVMRAAFVAYAGWPDDDEAIYAAVKALDGARGAVERVLWCDSASGGAVFESDALQITDAAQEFTAWVQSVAERAVPDPEEAW